MSYTAFLVLIVIVAVLLILIIMVQNPKGGGLSSSFGGGGTQALGGVQNTTNFLDKSTWTLSIILLALILASNFVAPNRDNIPTDTNLNEKLDNREIPATPIEETPASTNDSL